MNQRDVVILAGARTPLGKLNGALSPLTAVELGAAALRAAIERSHVDVADIDAVIFGQVLQAGSGQGPAAKFRSADAGSNG